MALDIVVTTDRINRDAEGRELIQHFRSAWERLGLEEAVLYYDFPAYADYETALHKPDALLLSPLHGVLAFRIPKDGEAWLAIDESLEQFCNLLISRFLKSRLLRAGRANLSFAVTPVLLALAKSDRPQGIESEFCTSLASVDALLQGHQLRNLLPPDVFAEARSVLEGAKALSKPQKRVVANPDSLPLAAAVAELEADIANFDEKQRRAALITIAGPQRIRGLAGSGKTVIIAMKAAHLHLTQPDRKILVTFYTRSLRSSLKNLITRFYRHCKDEDPDWDLIHVRHGWGGGRTPGVYADACRRSGTTPLNFAAAQQQAPTGAKPFDYACRSLLKSGSVEPYYEHILIDEGQDFPPGFYELCYALSKGDRDHKSLVWVYDELQNIVNVTMPSAEQLFGTDVDNQPRVLLDRTAAQLPPGANNDTVLSKCYRNQREVLVVAHALGFGIYREPVQLLESTEHWSDVGYQVVKGTLQPGEEVRILRPEENSPLRLGTPEGIPLIATHVADSFSNEVAWVRRGVEEFLAGGLQPEDILVVSLDDRNTRSYFKELASRLAEVDVRTNDIAADPYSEPPFVVPGHVTLSTVYRAKGNEAAVVFAIGVDAISARDRSSRNKLFTAFTRTKGWLRVSGMGRSAKAFAEEVTTAQYHFPELRFVMPDLAQVELIQRDLSERQSKALALHREFLEKLKSEGLSQEEVEEYVISEIKGGVKEKNGPTRGSKRNS